MGKWLSKNGSWILLNLPAFGILVALVGRPGLWKALTPYTGYTALSLLVLVLSVNPLQALIPTALWVKKVNKYRRQIGVAAFSYAVLHFFCFFTKRGYSISQTFWYFFHPALLPAVLALVVLMLLALTSNNYAVKRMGFLQWKKLHKRVYVAEALILAHMILGGAGRYALLAFIPLMGLQLMRERKRRRAPGIY